MQNLSDTKTAVLTVSFGTSCQKARTSALDVIEQEVGAAFPGCEARRAYTSGMIRRKLANNGELQIDSVAQAADRLAAEGFTRLIVQPTHVLHGLEYDKMCTELRAHANRFQSVTVGRPLLSSPSDYRQVAKIIETAYAPAPDTALALMGHGSTHFANCAYDALSYHLLDDGYPQILIGTVEGEPDFDDLLRRLRCLAVKTVTLAPLMVVAGDHAQNDMAGEDDDSWRSRLESEGFAVKCICKGLGELSSIRRLFVEHALSPAPL